MVSVFTAASLPLLAALAWAWALVTLAGPWPRPAVVAIAADLVLLATVAVVGMILGRSRWARRLAAATATAGLALGAFVEFGAPWVVAAATSAAALGAVTGPWLKGWVRERPAALGPPEVAVVLEILLLAIPGIVGAAAVGGLGAAAIVGIAAAPLAAFWYAKTVKGAVVAVRLLYPAVAVVTGIFEGGVTGLVLAVVGVAAGALAWTSGVLVAARPLTTKARSVPIPAELTPPEILEAAGLDERGRRKT